MNKKIKELVEQAGIEFDDNSGFESEPIFYLNQTDLKQFAELIVKECAGIAYEYDIPNISGILPGQFIGNRMKRLFGIWE